MNRFEELKKYKELLDEGIITQEEFDIKKKEFLDAPAIQSAGKEKGAGPLSSENIDEMLEKARSAINVDERKKEFVNDFKALKDEGVKRGLKKMSAGTAVILAVIVCVIVVATVVLLSQNESKSSYSSSGSGSSYSDTLSESEIETFAEYGVLKALKDEISKKKWNSAIDPYSCYINVNTYSRDDDTVTAYGTVHLRDKYGNITSQYISGSTYSLNFEITLSNSGATQSCKFSS